MNQTTKTIFSQRWDLIKPDLLKIWKGFLIALAGGTAAYLETVAGQINFTKDFGPTFGPLVLIVFSSANMAVVNALLKFAGKTTYIDQQ